MDNQRFFLMEKIPKDQKESLYKDFLIIQNDEILKKYELIIKENIRLKKKLEEKDDEFDSIERKNNSLKHIIKNIFVLKENYKNISKISENLIKYKNIDIQKYFSIIFIVNILTLCFQNFLCGYVVISLIYIFFTIRSFKKYLHIPKLKAENDEIEKTQHMLEELIEQM